MASIILLAIAVYLAGGGLLYFFQRNLLYFPTPDTQHSFEEIEFAINGEHIKVIALENHTESAMLYFGGNAENVATTAADFYLNAYDASIYLVNYRGYGGSTGEPTETTLKSDALLIYDALKAQYTNVFVIGRSLGSAIATHIAAQRQVSGLALITPFDSIERIAQNRFPIYPVGLLLRDKFDSVSLADKIHSPTLVIIAEQDEVIPRINTDRLINGFTTTTYSQVVIPQAGHNTVSQEVTYHRAIRHFLQR